MNEFVSNLLRLYGIWVILAAGIFAFAVWYLADRAAAPGAPVKVLFGFVEYTKPEPQLEQTPAVSIAEAPAVEPADPAPTPPQQSLGSTTLEIRHGLTSNGYPKEIAAIRARHALRELRPIESDRPIDSSPPGTFFFIYAGNIQSNPYSPCHMELVGDSAYRFQSDSWFYFEGHHRGDGQLLLLAYASESDADRIRTLTGNYEFEIILAPRPWENSTSLIELPFERFISCDNRDIEIDEDQEITVLDATVR